MGAFLGTQSLDGNFGELHHGFGEVVAGRRDNVTFNATMDIVVQRSGHVRFMMNGDDGFALWLDDRLLINEWQGGRLRVSDVSTFEFVQPGIHTLRMRYFEGVGESILRFETDPDVLQWTEVVCSGTRSIPPSTRYFVFDPAGATINSVSDRFDSSVPAIIALNPELSSSPVISKPVLLPGSAQPEKNRKLIVIQGIDSSAEINIISEPPNFAYRRQLILPALRSWPGADSKFFDEEDVIGFSYGDTYRDSTLGTIVSGDDYQVGHQLIPVYGKLDTCAGVTAGASKLDRLVKRIVQVEPDVSIDFLGHSMGGMVTAYWISQQDSGFLSRYVGSVITLDSPLLDGHLDGSLFSSCRFDDQAWLDIANPDSVALANINDYSKTTLRVPFYHINSSAIGDVLPGGVQIPGSCGTVATDLISQLFSHLSHSCLWYENDTLNWVANVIFSPGTILFAPRPIPTLPTPTPAPTPTPTPTSIPVDSLDSDGDGLIDSAELRIGTNPYSVDTDFDGLSDLLEVQLLTDPLIADTDADGLLDGDEVNRGTNPLRFDTDEDGLSDGDEVNIYGTNPLSQDTDFDGVIDSADLFPLYDADVVVSVVSFDDVSSSSADIFGGDGDPFFAVTVQGQVLTSQLYMDTRHVTDVPALRFDVPDDISVVTVAIQVLDSDFDAHDVYDVSGDVGVTTLTFLFNRLGGEVTVSGDGRADGGLQGLQGVITVRVSSG